MKATILFITWRDDKVVCAEIYGDLDCSSIHVAEAYVVLALFFKCFEMEIKDLVLWTNFDISGPPKEAVLAHQKKQFWPTEGARPISRNSARSVARSHITLLPLYILP